MRTVSINVVVFSISELFYKESEYFPLNLHIFTGENSFFQLWKVGNTGDVILSGRSDSQHDL